MDQPSDNSQKRQESDWLNERSDPINMRQWQVEFRAVNWRRLFPIKAWFNDRPWTLVWVQLLGFVFCFPLLMIHYYNKGNTPLAEIAWALSLYFSILWAILLHRCMRPDGVQKRWLVGTWLFTSVLGCLIVLFLSAIAKILPVFRDLFEASRSASLLGRFFGLTFGVGLVEEGVKCLPILWFAFHNKTTITRVSTVAYLGAISGLAFGATEAIVYSIAYAMGHASQYISYGDYLVVQILRLVSLPFLHAIWSATLGVFIALAVIHPKVARMLIATGLLLVATLHGGYNTFSDTWYGFLIALISFFLFVGYLRAESTILSELLVDGHP